MVKSRLHATHKNSIFLFIFSAAHLGNSNELSQGSAVSSLKEKRYERASADTAKHGVYTRPMQAVDHCANGASGPASYGVKKACHVNIYRQRAHRKSCAHLRQQLRRRFGFGHCPWQFWPLV